MHFVIIGNGIAGNSAASTIRRLNKEADITIISEETYPLYSACVLANYVSGETGRERIFLKAFPDYLQENIQLISGQKAIALDVGRKRVILESESKTYDKLIIAAGSKPVVPAIKGKDKKGVFTFKSVDDADRIYGWDGQTVVVVGSGPIGIEISLALNKKGYRVFLVELLDWILPRVFDEYPASIIKDILEQGGIEVSTGERVLEILGSDRVEGVATDRRRIICDTVILAAGMRTEVELAEGALKLGELGGILVDDRLCTSVPDVYACGDCIEVKDLVTGHPALSLLWHNARWQGEIAGCNAAGIPRNYPGSLNFTGVELFGTQAVSIGTPMGTSQDGQEVIERKRDGSYKRVILSNGVPVGVQSINWSENMGASLTAMLRQEKVKNFKDLLSWRRSPSTFPKWFPFGRH